MTSAHVDQDRACGVLLGQACGEALGVPYEFASPPRGHEQARMLGGGLGSYAPGEWSDDTQMAACIAHVSATGVDLTSEEALDEVAERFLAWAADGPADIGIQTRSVLSSARRGTGGAAFRLSRAAAHYAAHHSRAAGNGALMRTSVVGLTRLDDRDATAAAARAIAELTHGDPLAGDSAVLWSEAIRVAVTEGRLDVAGGLDLLPASRRGDWQNAITEATTQPPGSFTGNGFTVTALQAAWASIVQTVVPDDSPEQGSYPCLHLQSALQTAVRIGHDTDTVAAIAGGLLGAFWGQSAVPLTWVRRVHGWPGLRARDLVRLASLTATRGRSDVQGWPAVERFDYGHQEQPAVPHPMDDGVLLGTEKTAGHEATAVVSLFRRGTLDVPSPGVAPWDHVEVRLLDANRPSANRNLAFSLADTAALIDEMRAEDHRVLVHCVQAQQRTPSVALAYAVRRGATAEEGRRLIAQALPRSRRSGRLWEVAGRSGPARLTG